VDLTALSAIELKDASGTKRRLGSLWAEQPVVVVFLRHFGCLHCRDHAAELRDRYAELRRSGADVAAIGTGSVRYAQAFVEDDRIPFPVLVDDDGLAARAAQVRSTSFLGMFHPRTWRATADSWRRGFRIHKAGKRVTQLGATFVIGPGPRLLYAHVDSDSADHAPLPEVLAAVAPAATR
jgi:peroxiredoxin